MGFSGSGQFTATSGTGHTALNPPMGVDQHLNIITFTSESLVGGTVTFKSSSEKAAGDQESTDCEQA